MTIEIITRGKDPKEVPFRASCSNCGTSYQATVSDCKYDGDQRDGYYYSFNCKVCPHTVMVSEDSVRHQRSMARS
jgi:transcription elongation factor Elf1